MPSARFSLSLIGVIGIVIATLAAAALWLSVTNPESAASAVEAASQGSVSPMLKALGDVIFNALQGLIKYL